MLTVQMPHPSHDRVECAIHHEGGYVPLRHAELFMRGFRMTEIQWHWCFSLGEYHDGKRSLNRRGTKSRRRRGFDKCQRSLRGGRVLPQLREGPTRHPWVVRTVRDPLSPSALFGQHGRSQGISCRRGRRGITGENDPKLSLAGALGCERQSYTCRLGSKPGGAECVDSPSPKSAGAEESSSWDSPNVLGEYASRAARIGGPTAIDLTPCNASILDHYPYASNFNLHLDRTIRPNEIRSIRWAEQVDYPNTDHVPLFSHLGVKRHQAKSSPVSERILRAHKIS